MTDPTPPSDPDDGVHRDPEAGSDAILELTHASIDGELTADEYAGISPDETWRLQVERARADCDTVQQALSIVPVDDTRRDAHIDNALAAFDEVYGTVDVDAAPSPPPPPGARPGDQLAHRGRANAWVRRAPIGIAAAVLAAVVVVGASQLGDDEPTDTVAMSDEAGDDAGDGGDSVDDAAEASPAPASEEDGDSQIFGETTASGMVTYALNDESSSLDVFVDSVTGMLDDDYDMQSQIADRIGLDLGPRCTEDDVVELAATLADKPDLTLVQGVLDGRPVVGVINRSDPVEVTVIDLDRCAVEAVRSL